MSNKWSIQRPSSNIRIFFIFSILFIALLIDISISNISDIITEQLVSSRGLALFMIISAVSILGQYYILNVARQKISQDQIRPNNMNKIVYIVTIIQSIVILIYLAAVIEILVSSSYQTYLLSLAVALSYGLVAFVMAILSKKLISWFKLNKSLVVLLYFMAALLITLNAVCSIALNDVVLAAKQPSVTPQSKVNFEVAFKEGTVMDFVSKLQTITFNGYFLFVWAATALILRHNMKRIGRIKYWILVALPLVYFMGYYFSFYQQLNPSNPFQAGQNLIVPILSTTYGIAACGILFGIGFIAVSKSVKQNTSIRDHMILAGLGFILFINAGNAIVSQAPFPPYGLANISYVGLSSFLILVGVYQSAISVAQDVTLRQIIKKSAIETSKLLGNIGTAQMLQEVEKRALEMRSRRHKEIEVKSSLSDEELKEYVKHVVTEITKERP